MIASARIHGGGYPGPVAHTPSQSFGGALVDLYDVFVDWKGRLGREMPGLVSALRAVDAERVLDLGCGTGRHVEALALAGFDAVGTDASEAMLARAAQHLGGRERLEAWRMGEPPTTALLDRAPFDALVALGNVWPQLLSESETRAAAAACLQLLRPGGLLILGLKALAVRESSGQPYMPLLRREHEGSPLWFVRFVDFAEPALEDGTRVAGFHMLIVSDGAEGEPRAHRVGRLRVWDAEGLAQWFRTAGFEEVSVSGALGDPTTPATSEDVFLQARAPSGT